MTDEGGYAIRVRMETAEAFYTTLITDLALVTKRAPGKLLVYASSYSKKKPVAGVRLEFLRRGRQTQARGRH